MTDPIFRQKMSMWETSKQSARVGLKVIQGEGIAALMKGSLTFSLKRVADWGTRFYFAVLSEDLLFKKGDLTYVLSNQERLAASLIGGGLSSLLTLPLDVMVAQIQQASKAGQKVSVLATFQAEFKQGGWERVAGFATKGFVARTLHVALTTGKHTGEGGREGGREGGCESRNKDRQASYSTPPPSLPPPLPPSLPAAALMKTLTSVVYEKIYGAPPPVPAKP